MSEKKEYIERGALSKFVRDVRKRLPKDSKDFFTRDEMLLNFQQYVDAQPAADVEPVVRGEWQKVYENTTFGAMYRCSVCGETTFNVENFKYCPKCGTHMSMERSGSGE